MSMRPGLMHCAAALGLACGPPVQALEFEITPSAAYRFGGQFQDTSPTEPDDTDIEESAAFAVALDAVYAPGQAIELFYSRQQTGIDGSAGRLDLDVEYFQLGGVASYPLERAYEPYIVGTIGAARFTPGGGLQDETRFAATLGGGVKYALGANLALRLEARGYLSFFDTDADVFCLSDAGGALCRWRAKGNVVWQLEAQAGLTFRF